MNTDAHAHIIPAELMKSEFLSPEVEQIGPGVYSYVIWGSRIRPAYAALNDERIHLSYMEEQNIQKEYLSVPPYLFGYDKDSGFGREWSRAYNESLAALCRRHPARFGGLGTVPMQDVPSAVAELSYCVNTLGFAGVELCSHVNQEDLDEERFADFFEAANKLGCAILIHPHNIPAPRRLSKYYMANLVGNPTETALTAARMLLSGFFDRYPGLRVCFSHGGGAFPFVYGRIKNGFSVRDEPKAGGLKTLELPRNMFFDTIVYDRSPFRFMLETVGAERVLLGTDYPFDMRMREPVVKIQGWCEPIEAKLVTQENPMRFFRMGE